MEKYDDLAGVQAWVLKASRELPQDKFRNFLLQFSAYLSKEGERFAERAYIILAQFDPETVAILLFENEHPSRVDRILRALAQMNSGFAERIQVSIAVQAAAMEAQRQAEIERAAESARQAELRREEAQRRLDEEQRARAEHAKRQRAQREEAQRLAVLLREAEKQRQIGVLREHNVERVAHITHIDNLEGILRDGLLARNHFRGPPVDIADADVNARRDRIEPIYQRRIHDYVPFYINVVNPMLSARRDALARLTILHVATSHIIQSECRWVVSDGNAAAGSTQFFGKVEDLGKLDWHCLRAMYWNDIPGGKRTRMAEVLVETRVPSDWIVQIDCFTKGTMARATALTERVGGIRVVGRANPFP